MSPVADLAHELQALIAEYDHVWMNTYDVRVIIRPHIAGEFYPWTLPAGTMVLVTRPSTRLVVRYVSMERPDDECLG